MRPCGYCGLRAGNRLVERYRMSADEILQCARNAQASFGERPDTDLAAW